MLLNKKEGTFKMNNQFPTKLSILNPQKTPENQRFSDPFKEYKMKYWPEMC